MHAHRKKKKKTLSALPIISEYVSSFSRDRVLNYMLDIIIFFIADFYFYANLSRLLGLTKYEKTSRRLFFLHENTPYELSVYQIIIYYITHHNKGK